MRPSRRWSLRWRVTAGATAILTLALVAAALTAAGLLRRSLEQDQAALLADRIDEVELLIRGGDLPAVLQPGGRDVGQVQVVRADGTVAAATPGLASSTRLDVIDAPPVGGQDSAVLDGARIGRDTGERYKVVARTVWSPSSPLTVYAVTSLAAAEHAERFLRNGLLVGVPLLVLLAGTVTYWVVGRALAPVDEMRAEVDAIEAAGDAGGAPGGGSPGDGRPGGAPAEAFDLSGRVHVRESDDEISRLGKTLNRMLDRLDESAARQRLFGAAASHELRSPLSAIRTELEVGLAYPDAADWTQIAADSLVEVERLEQLARDLRLLTRIQQPGAVVAPVQLGALVEAEVTRRAPRPGVRYVLSLPAVVPQTRATPRSPATASPVALAPPSTIGAGAARGDVWVAAEGDAVVQVLRNLLDNAERHARTIIRVSVGMRDGHAELRVANDGPAVPLDQRDRIFEPFHRLDDARSLDAGGSGLGLAIARSLVTTVGGTLQLDEGAPGIEAGPSTGGRTGASFTARFPLGSPPSPNGPPTTR